MALFSLIPVIPGNPSIPPKSMAVEQLDRYSYQRLLSASPLECGCDLKFGCFRFELWNIYFRLI